MAIFIHQKFFLVKDYFSKVKLARMQFCFKAIILFVFFLLSVINVVEYWASMSN